MPDLGIPTQAGARARFAGRSVNPFDGLSVALLVVLAVVAALTFRDYGIAWDDPVQMTYGDLVLKFLGSGFADQQAIHFRDLRFYGGLFEAPVQWLAHLLPLPVFDARHLFCAMAGIATVAAAWRFGRHLGGPPAGFLAAVFLTFLPSFYGHMFINSKDVPFALGYLLALMLTVRVAEDFPRVPASRALLLGLAFGLAMGIRVAGVVVVFYLVAALVLDLVWRQGRKSASLGQAARGLVPVLVLGAPVAYVLMVAFWPWALLDPIAGPVKSILESAKFHWDGLVLLDGAYVRSTALPASYIPVYLGVKLPEILLLALLAAVPAAAWGLLGALRAGDRKVAFGVVVLGLGILFPLVFSVAAGSVHYDAIRHFLFVLPPMAVLAGWQVAGLAQRLFARQRALAAGLAAVGVIGFGAAGWGMHSLHPYEYVYYNGLAGGLAGASGRFETDYWATSYREAVARMVIYADRTAGTAPRGFAASRHGVVICGPPGSAAPFLPGDFRLVQDVRRADFFISYTRWKCDRRIDAPVAATVERNGVPLAYVKDLRGGFSIRRIDEKGADNG